MILASRGAMVALRRARASSREMMAEWRVVIWPDWAAIVERREVMVASREARVVLRVWSADSRLELEGVDMVVGWLVGWRDGGRGNFSL